MEAQIYNSNRTGMKIVSSNSTATEPTFQNNTSKPNNNSSTNSTTNFFPGTPKEDFDISAKNYQDTTTINKNSFSNFSSTQHQHVSPQITINEFGSKDDEKNPVEIDRIVKDHDETRAKSGIKGFDELIEGGFERESIILVVGSAGTGKTILGLQFLHQGAKEFNESGVFISFEEEKEQIYKHAKQFGWDFENLEQKNQFRLIQIKPHQMDKVIEEGGGQVRDALAEVGAKRVVVDSITSYEFLFTDDYKRREKILEFFNLLKKWGLTAMIICEELPSQVEREQGNLSFISDAVLSMYYQHDEEKGIRIHSLEVLKMRGTRHTNKLCAISFESDGIHIYPDVEVF
jgi:circadian clock protein KaiC